ncbi:palmitoyltransferase [Martiniozyma asiatica (nom. inval.)]|nr:palmitoyltransferase [Martiniozyma asiatica]
MVKVIILILFLLILGFFTFVGLFGDLPSNNGTWIHKSHIILAKSYKYFLNGVNYADHKLFNGYFTSPKVVQKVKWFAFWCIPIFYLFIMGECLKLFFTETYPQILHYDHLTNWKTRMIFIIIPTLTTNFFVFLFAVFTDAGHLNQENFHKYQFLFPLDNIIYHSYNCSTCHIPKIARSKHCSTCDKCILLFDHHCIWLNNDVGYYNYRYFLLFLMTTMIILSYGGFLCVYSIHLFISNESNLPDLFKAGWFFQRYYYVINQSTWSNLVSGLLFMMCSLLGPAVGAFLIEHFKMIYLGVTTNETAKWDYVHDLMINGWLFKYEYKIGNDINQEYVILNRIIQGNKEYVKLSDNSVIFLTANDRLTAITSWNQLDNLYDRGFWQNLKDRFFPQYV